jgi:hypothetical protein
MRQVAWVLGILGASLLATPDAHVHAAATGCLQGYSYSGLFSDDRLYGLAATITPSAAELSSGHVAAYVNVGSEVRWLQIGVNTADATAGATQRLYYELRQPGQSPEYHELGAVAAGQSVRVAVAALRARPGYWQLYAAGRPSGSPIYLPGSRGGLEVSASAETWLVNNSACNGFAYEFASVRTLARPGAAWRPGQTLYEQHDPGTGFSWRSRTSVSFTAWAGTDGTTLTRP